VERPHIDGDEGEATRDLALSELTSETRGATRGRRDISP
jgi:hypothetical protein